MRKAGIVVSEEDAHAAYTLPQALFAHDESRKFNTGPVRATLPPRRTRHTTSVPYRAPYRYVPTQRIPLRLCTDATRR